MTDTGGPTRADTWLINVQIEHPTNGNMLNYGTWDKVTGGGLDSDEATYRPGGMAPPVSLGGAKTVDNLVVSRLYRIGRDHAVVQQMFDSVGKCDMIVSKQPLDIEGNVEPGVKPIVYSGTLKRVTPPDVDSTSTDPALLELEMVIEGYPTS